MSEDSQSGVAAVLAALAELSKSYDPIADAEELGKQAFADGLTLQECVDENEIDLDTDAGMACVVAFRASRKAALAGVRALAVKDVELTEFERLHPDGDPLADADADGRGAFMEGRSIVEVIDDYGINPSTPEGVAFIAGYNDEANKRVKK